jgi:hypothetical protein
MGSQPFGGGQATGGGTLYVCVESFFYDDNGTAAKINAGATVDPSHPAVALAPERFQDATQASYAVSP